MSIDNVMNNKILDLQNTTSYQDFLDDVVLWNKTCESSYPALEKQWELVKEETQELCEAFDSGNIQHFFKELCDSFVVSSYAAYLVFNEIEATTYFSDDITYLIGKLTTAVEEDQVIKAYYTILELMNSVNQEALGKTMQAVLRSNWSKIFPEEESAAELAFAKAGYAGRYSGIYVQNKPTGCVLKDDKNKVLKPSSYKAYEEYL